MIRVRKRVTRRRFLGLASLATLSALAGCGGNTPAAVDQPKGFPPGPTGPKPSPAALFGLLPVPISPSPTATPSPHILRFGHWETGATGRILSDLAQSFNANNPNTIVRPEVASFGNHFVNLQQSFAASNPPDVFITTGAFFDDQRQANGLANLGQRFVVDAVDLTTFWSEPIVKPINGQLYALPIWAAADVVLLNLDRLNAAKVDLPTDNWTWASFLAAAQKATIGRPGEISQWGTLIVNDFQGGWGSFITTNSGHWLDSNKDLKFDRAATDALRWVADAMLVHHVAPSPTEQHALTRGGTLDPFLSGNVAMFPTGTWEIPAALASAKFTWDVISVPRPTVSAPGGPIGSVQPGALAHQGKQLDLAWRFLKFMLERNSQERFAVDKIRLPSLKAVAQDSETGFSSSPPIHASTVAQTMAGASDLQFSPHWQAMRGGVVSALDRAFDGRTSLEDGLATAVTAGNAVLSKEGT